ncbi:MAG: hypothetical protein ACFFF4_10755 [Candidatus Thorarchaeota archaeon]
MKRKEITRLVVVAALAIFLVIPFATAQTSLVPNATREDEFIWGRTEQFYESMLYEADLTAGHWTVRIATFFDLSINITVATDSGMTSVIAESGSGWGNYPEVDFNLASDATVYILIQENSVYGDSSGFYNIGVYDDAHISTIPTTTTFTFTTDLTWTDPFSFSTFLGSFFLIFGIIVAVVFIVAIVICLRMRSTVSESALQTIRAPQTAIPEQYKTRAEQDDGLRMVRIPVECPKCKAPLSQETIDWVGPLEAKCQYCGSTVRATFEKV